MSDKITIQDINNLEQVIQNDYAKYEDYSIHEDYSGRCMYGKTCFAISGNLDSWDVANLLLQAFDQDHSRVSKMMENRRQDSLGYGSIVYFPNYEVEVED